MKMSNVSISFILLLGLLLSGKVRLSLCDLKCSKPEPYNECWKLIIQYIQNDGNNGRVPPPILPFPDCCPEVRDLGFECFWFWVDHENAKMGYREYDVEVIYYNTNDTWNFCQEKSSLRNV
ncbi:unnamed protein product [Cuscuta europaea]|uniref:Uncharacterized protein n=1 Tax=Cuscuta europaea TaxID=41803 RepID=A0A9P1EEH9_CUSEU|nr:unnamed protein product [Cuscuta europaea]